ncbi:hypothetical protein J416_07177 [Gracilibacillus halophilus YIM-C55.5]|uniref:Calcineurin-like phosphoesterase domain-containing protein n=1 Tax=Gracilibacillus halophilus YIM-C55.5 TaxID=1308866 RepID=N4WA78_9BACI|nr:metallophosphoesterase [Gracilibacillus halophilus]ENH97203.1 hypothetical protein J416_07177 [Gracilibacillus halophilus YIM-C55.5]
MNRRTFIKRLFTSALALFGLTGGTYYYAREIEPKMLRIRHQTIESTNIPESFDGFRILQFSDTHIGYHYTINQLENLAAEINQLTPDLVVFTGDLVDHPDQFDWDDRISSCLQNITSKHGKYWIYGNHDHGGYGTDIVKQVFDKSEFKLLQNSHTILQKNDDKIVLAGVDDALLGDPSVTNAVSNQAEHYFTILLAHEPDYADSVSQYPIDVQLSGHSHGGQVQIPFVGYVYTPYLAEKYVEGEYQIGQYPLQLHVSRGIGTTRLPYRFLCRPEMTVFQLSSTSHTNGG